MNLRIIEVRKCLHLTQEAFSSKIKLTRSTIANIENGNRAITDRVLSDICREFNVNERWLLTGERGESAIFNQLDTDERLSYALGKIMAGDDEFIKHTMLSLADLDPEQWSVIKNLVQKIAGETN